MLAVTSPNDYERRRATDMVLDHVLPPDPAPPPGATIGMSRRNTLKAVATYVGKPGTRELLRDVLVAQGWAGDDPDGAAESAETLLRFAVEAESLMISALALAIANGADPDHLGYDVLRQMIADRSTEFENPLK